MGDFDGDKESIQAQYDWSTIRPSLAVVNAISSIENAEPIDLSITLYDHINPEALDTLVIDDSNITISFTLNEYRIRIDGNRLVITYD